MPPRTATAGLDRDAPPDPVLDEMIEAMGGFFEGFGFKRHVGRLWMTLYLSLEPMTQSQLQKRLGLSAGMVSTLLRELSSWNAVHVRTLPSSRQTWYQAETDLLAYVARILRRRDLNHVQELDRQTTRAIDTLTDRGDPESARLARLLRRIRQLASLYEAMSSLVIRLADGPPESVRRGIRLVKGLRLSA
jgi:DNA-binding transcriptional regulator GbsR (MarR family)